LLPLSIVITAVKEAEPLEATLVSVLENRPAECEIIVAHNGFYDDPYDLDGEVTFVRARGRWIDCLRAGVEAAGGEAVHLLSAGTTVEEGWTQPALDLLADRRVGSVAPLLLDERDQTRVLAAGVNCTRAGRRHVVAAGLRCGTRQMRLLEAAGPTLQAGFYRREVIAECGGVPTRVGPKLADVDLALSMSQLGYDCRIALDCRTLAPQADIHRQSAFAEALAAERFYRRHHATLLKSLLTHPAEIALELLAGLPSPRIFAGLAGRIHGMLACGPEKRFRRELLGSDPEPPTLAALPAEMPEENELPEESELPRAA